MKFILSLLLLFSNAAEAARTVQADVLEGQLSTPNWTVNPSCRANTRSITASAGSITRITADNARLDSETACRWAAAGAGNTLEFTTKQMPRGYAQGNCEVSFRYFSGVGTFTARAVNASGFVSEPVTLAGDGSNLLSNPVRIVLPCGGDYTTPGPGPILRITAAGANSIDVAMVQSGPVTSIGQFSAVSEWQPYTPTFTGFGTVTVQSFRWRRVGGAIEIEGRFTSGTTTATEARVSLPNNFVAASDYATFEVVGTGGTASVGAAVIVLQEPNQTYMTFGWAGSGSQSMTKANANTFTSGNAVSLSARIRVQGLSASQSAAAANQTDFGPREVGPMTITAVSVNPTKGTTVTDSVIAERKGKFLIATYRLDMSGAGTAGTGDYLFQVPLGLSIDTTNNPLYTGVIGARDMPKSRMDATGRMWQSTPATANFVGAIPYTATTFRMVIQSEYSASVFQGSGSFSLAAAMGFSFTVKIPIAGWEENQRAPTLVGSVTSNSVGAERIERVLVSDTGVVSNESGDWINGNCTNAAPTVCTFNSGTFSATPVCVASGNTAGNTEGLNVVSTSTTVSVQFNSNVKRIFSLICMGPR